MRPLLLAFPLFLGLSMAGACSRTELEADPQPDASIPVDARPDVVDAAPDVKPLACVPGRFVFERAETQLLFVLDRSGSMRFSLDGSDQAPAPEDTRWQILKRSLSPSLAALQGNVQLGAKFFPGEFRQSDPDAEQKSCDGSGAIDLAPVQNNAAAILSVFDRTQPLGGTPTAEAMQSARNYLVSGGRRYLARFLVLATDGAPNCNADPAITIQNCVCTASNPVVCTDPANFNPEQCLDAQRAVDTIRAIHDVDNVPSYVIGVGGDSSAPFRATLNAMAVAGGRSRNGSVNYYDGSTEAGLSAAADSIKNGVTRCVYVTPSAPVDPNAISVEINGVSIPRDPQNQNGWNWSDQAFGSLSFFGAACDTLLGNPAATVSGTVACPDAGP